MSLEIPATGRASYAVTFEPVPEAAGAARVLLRDALPAWGMADLVEGASLVATELVANAIRSGRDIGLEIYPHGSFLYVEVFDTSPEPPRKSAGDLLWECGRGLALVAAYADDWNYRLVPGGKIVWARLGPAAPRTSSGANPEPGAVTKVLGKR
jgi:anti-sigma regulatory factor (Ser/Thr protein kinase)